MKELTQIVTEEQRTCGICSNPLPVQPELPLPKCPACETEYHIDCGVANNYCARYGHNDITLVFDERTKNALHQPSPVKVVYEMTKTYAKDLVAKINETYIPFAKSVAYGFCVDGPLTNLGIWQNLENTLLAYGQGDKGAAHHQKITNNGRKIGMGLEFITEASALAYFYYGRFCPDRNLPIDHFIRGFGGIIFSGITFVGIKSLTHYLISPLVKNAYQAISERYKETKERLTHPLYKQIEHVQKLPKAEDDEQIMKKKE